MKLISLNVGQPRIVDTARGQILTSIFKEPVDGPRQVVKHNVDGDRQADLTVHGGPNKAVYAYALEHYSYWEKTLPQPSLPFGAFGENLTVEGLLESEIHVGDVLEIGTVHLRVTQPRMPCVKLAIRFERPDMVKLFWNSRRSGVYFAVEQPGIISPGDGVRMVHSHPTKVSLADVINLYTGVSADNELLQRFMAAPIAGSWKQGVQERWNIS